MTNKEFSFLNLFLAGALACLAPFCDVAPARARTPNRDEAEKARSVAAAGVPFILDSQRILLEVAIETPDGGVRKTLAWFNMGMAAPIFSKTLYRELTVNHREIIRILVAGKAVDAPAQEIVDGDGGLGVPTFSHLFGPRPVEAMLPASVLQHYVVTLDYGRRVFSLVELDTQKPDGVAVPCLINPQTGVISVEAEIGGAAYPLALDAGAGYSWMRGDIAKRWLIEHPDWRRAEGAVGQANANMVDFDFEKEGVVFRIPQIGLGALRLDNVGALGTAPVLGALGDSLFGDLFWDNWRKAAPAPVVGWIGGNVLKDYKLTIDYPNHITYWRKQKASDPHEFDQIGLTLVRHDEHYFVGGIVHKVYEGSPEASAVEGVQIGDELVAVDGAVVRGAGKDVVLSALRGKPGETRRLLLERGGVRVEVEATVTRFD